MRARRAGGRADGRTGGKSFLAALRRLAGMPDYEIYVEHLSRCHPDRPLPSRKQFYEEFTRSRYGDGPTRCC